MIQLILYSLIISLSIIFIKMNHPLAMGLMLLIYTILISLLTGFMSKSFWFSYILFLVFLGGMLVLFIYVTSLASNEMFSFSTKLLFLTSMLFILFNLIIMNMDLMLPLILNNNLEISNLNYTPSMYQENSLTINKLYNYPMNLMTFLLMNYLLITLIAVVKITKLFYGPLRMMN